MSATVRYIVAVPVLIHGLIHLMGFFTYWQLAVLDELPYKTTLLNGRWEVGDAGMRVFGVLWLVAAVAFVLADVGLVTQQAWWRAAMVLTALVSVVICVLDWQAAFRGAIISAVILVGAMVIAAL